MGSEKEIQLDDHECDGQNIQYKSIEFTIVQIKIVATSDPFEYSQLLSSVGGAEPQSRRR